MKKNIRYMDRWNFITTVDLDPYRKVLLAVLKQALEDALSLRYNKQAYWQSGDKAKDFRRELWERVRASKDSKEFFETDRLDNFLDTYHLGLDAGHVRMKYYKRVKGGRYEEDTELDT